MLPIRPRCEVSAGFCLLCLWFAWAAGWEMLGAVLLSAAVHELGHLLVLWAAGARVRGVRVGVLGAVMEADTARLSYVWELWAVLAGPLANLLFAAALIPAGAEALIGANIVLCCFNLLPLPPLDGGRALRLGLSWALGPDRGEAISSGVGTLSALALSAFLIYLMAGTGGSLWLLPSCAASAALAVKKEKIRESFCKKCLHS